MITADTITVQQVDGLLCEAEAHAYPGADPKWQKQWDAADVALNRHGIYNAVDTRAGRVYLAHILNARAASGGGK